MMQIQIAQYRNESNPEFEPGPRPRGEQIYCISHTTYSALKIFDIHWDVCFHYTSHPPDIYN